MFECENLKKNILCEIIVIYPYVKRMVGIWKENEVIEIEC